MTTPLRILVVDESALYRKRVAEVLRSLAGVEVVATAVDAAVAVEKIDELRPHLVTIGVSLKSPGWGGLGPIRRANPKLDLVALPDAEADAGRPDWSRQLAAVVPKPRSGTIAEIGRTIESLARVVVERAQHRAARLEQAGEPEATADAQTAGPAPRSSDLPELVCIGISTGGPEALAKMLPRLPAHLPVPVLIVQHMPAAFTRSLAEGLDADCSLRVREAIDGRAIRPGEIWIAPGGRQMKIGRVDDDLVLRITDDPPENNCRPAVDYLFRSAAETCGAAVVAVIMTGMGADGLNGLRALKRRGARIVAQNRETCVVYGMPMAPIEEGLADEVVPLDEIAATIVRLVEKEAAPCR
jgi:two-component system chemotaxis response regulator CheB